MANVMDYPKKETEYGEPEFYAVNKENTFDTFVDLLRYRCQKHPEKIALNFLMDGELNAQVSLTYQLFGQQVYSIASWLHHNYEPQSRIVLLCPPGNEFIVAFAACLYAGIIAVPCVLPSRNRRDWEKVLTIAQDCQAVAIITTSLHLVDCHRKFDGYNFNIVDIDDIDDIDDVDYTPGQLLNDVTINDQDIAFLQYTSGSTGTPKGVMVNHQNLMHNQRLLQVGFNSNSKSRIVSWLPLFHDMGLIGCALHALYLGVSFNYMSPTAFIQKPIRWLRAITYFRATISGAPNFAYELCASRITESELHELDLACWGRAFNAAEPLRVSTVQNFYEKFSKCGLTKTAQWPCYGLAEGTLLVTGTPTFVEPTFRYLNNRKLEEGYSVEAAAGSIDSQGYVGVGSVVGDQILRIVNPETKQLCPINVVGEIWISGNSVAKGYWQRPQQTQEDFHAYIKDTEEGPFLRTGDAGFLDQNGQLFICARLKDMIILHGRNIFPQDIEKVSENSCPDLRSGCAAAFTIPVNNEEKVVVIQELRHVDESSVDFELVIRNIRQAIASEFNFNVFDVVLITPRSLLKTSSGKVQRRANKMAYVENTLNCVASHQKKNQGHGNASERSVVARPDSGIQHKETTLTQKQIEDWLIGKLIQLYPDTGPITSSYHFVDTGLTSVESIDLCHQLSQEIGVEIDPTQVWNTPSIDSFAKNAEQLQRTTPADPSKNIASLSETISAVKVPRDSDTSHQLVSLSIDQLTDLLEKELDS